ncbi:MAG TPA: hypothetical protein VN133_05680 [Humibacter sp.]|nr:hypothetical protein [Humibacter sp.]
MTSAAAPTARLTRIRSRLIVTAPGYTLEVEDAGERFSSSPYAVLFDEAGQVWTCLNLLCSVDTADRADETWLVEGVEAVQRGDDVALTVRTRSTAWRVRELTVLCTPRSVELSVRVEGSGRLTEVTLLGGRAGLPSGACGEFRSAIGFRSVLVPAPTEPVEAVRPAHAAAVLGVVGDADPGRLNGIFTPPPLVLGLGRAEPPMASTPGSDGRSSGRSAATFVPEGEWLGLSVRDAVQNLTFTRMRYEPLDGGFLLRFDYEGHTVADGGWTSPTLVLRPASTGWGVITDHRADLVEHGLAAAAGPGEEPWWREPIFCGWGAQCARAVHLLHAATHGDCADPTKDSLPQTREEEHRVARMAPTLARQSVYDEFLVRLDAYGLKPGTIVIDDRWQADYGTAAPDLEHWPDLRSWIAGRHRAGQRVLLWWKAWDPEGLPTQECIVDAAGRPVSVDPASPAYRRRLEGIVAALLGADGLDADGFKVDFTQRGPSGSTLRRADGVVGVAEAESVEGSTPPELSGRLETAWGIAGLHLLLKTLHTAAKRVKPDSLVIAHAVHPSFGDVCDMVRLNDVLKFDGRGRRVPVVDQLTFRQQVVRRTLPHHDIDTDQWPMPSRAEWLDYSLVQPRLGVPALYYLESIDRSGEHIRPRDLQKVASVWEAYRGSLVR